MADDELLWLARVARGCQRIVEVGSYQGRSTRALADHCPGVVFCVDTCNGGYVKG
jgi:predicted O-methyltransferase YrrM